MLKCKVICSTRLRLHQGQVTGEIIVDADSLLDAIYTNTYILPYSGYERMATRRLIAHMNNRMLKQGAEPVIHLLNGCVEKNSVEITLSEIMDLLRGYLEADNPNSEAYKNQDFQKLCKLVYACKDCSSPAETANVMID